MKYLLSVEEITDILNHWNSTKANAYRGSSYGENHNRILFQSMSMDQADWILAKLKQDIPLFASLDSDTLQILSEDLGNDVKRIHIAVGSVEIPIATTNSSNYMGDTFSANAQ